MAYEISSSTEIIREVATLVSSIKPDDMLFHFRYGLYLVNIANNELEGLDEYKKVQNIY